MYYNIRDCLAIEELQVFSYFAKFHTLQNFPKFPCVLLWFVCLFVCGKNTSREIYSLNIMQSEINQSQKDCRTPFLLGI